MTPIPYGHQSVSWLDALAVAKSVKAEWMTMGPALEKFETDIASVSGAKHAVAVSSGSAALHCAYASIDLGPGDEIITSPLTFASTATTAMNLGAKVVFADIHSDTGNIDSVQVESLRSLPSEIWVAATEMAEGSSLLINRSLKLQFLDDVTGSKVEVIANNSADVCLCLSVLSGAVGVDVNREGISQANGIGYLQEGSITKTCGDKRLSDETCIVSCGSIDLGGVLA